MVVDLSTNTAVKTFKYDSFGNITEETGDFSLPFRFAGGIYDEHTKLTRFGVREFRRNQRSYYDAETGRWTSKEPLGFAGARMFETQKVYKGYSTNQRSCHFYVYAHNDGVNFSYADSCRMVDLDGLYEKLIPNNQINYNLSKLDRTAIKYLKKFFCKGFLENREFIGEISEEKFITKRYSKKGAIGMTTSNRDSSWAFIHGHGSSGILEASFTTEDCDTSNYFMKRMYLVTQLKQVYVYIPNLLRYSAGKNSLIKYYACDYGTIMRLPDLDCNCPK